MNRLLLRRRSGIYADAVLALAPLAYWRLGEASGTVVTDKMGTNNGTYVGSPTLGAAGLLVGDPDTAVALSGSAQYATLGGINMSGWAGATISALILPTAYQGAGSAYIADVFVNDAGANLARIQMGSTGAAGGKDKLYGVLGSTAAIWSTPLSLGVPYHVIVTTDLITVRAYVDGVEVAAAAFTGALPNAASAAIGTNPSALLRTWIGTLDEPAIWNRVLTAAEIANLYAVARA